MSESHDQDDLPPGKEPPHDTKFSIMLGETLWRLCLDRYFPGPRRRAGLGGDQVDVLIAY